MEIIKKLAELVKAIKDKEAEIIEEKMNGADTWNLKKVHDTLVNEYFELSKKVR